MTIERLLVANRGEIALRVIRACQGLGISTVLAVSEADLGSLPARIADETVCIGPARSSDSYLSVAALVTAATGMKVDALHPGYGFLSESPALAEACADAGILFVGPTAAQMRLMGNKLEARRSARQAGVPMLAGSERVVDATHAAELAADVGYPVMMKAAAGGGGRGMKIVADPAALPTAFEAASAEAMAAFGDSTLYLERYLPNARHVEVQVLGDHFGTVVHVGERDCSLQRRHQKLVEEAPAPGLPEALRAEVRDAAVALAGAIGYRGAGTVEFLVDPEGGVSSFLEMNTRIQVEHGVTEVVSGIDLVEAQLRIAAGEKLWFSQDDVTLRGHAIECRVNAEAAEAGFRPNAGRITRFDPPQGPFVRVDTHCFSGYDVPIHYDSLLAKLIVYGSTRAEALRRMQHALDHFVIEGVSSNVSFQRYAVSSAEFDEARMTTQLVDEELLPAYAAGF
ncbi:acetyl/propionyl/methylcrotonyl-CoA carboxylase subunit alpha [Amycolatopsis sp. GM8]|uniref:acetyl-CoA carboxylase biotin carboxylase subunit n=1 Tax=Amycolatopsis sp. GM8 TaxID=2896530 RepID=UPI001F010BDB|nr:acetyl-CoA carboxylase biotin carboxylase subunit [Amycolatopsis sp. GM8]